MFRLMRAYTRSRCIVQLTVVHSSSYLYRICKPDDDSHEPKHVASCSPLCLINNSNLYFIVCDWRLIVPVYRNLQHHRGKSKFVNKTLWLSSYSKTFHVPVFLFQALRSDIIIFCNTYSDSDRSSFRSFFFIFKWNLRVLSMHVFVSSFNYVAERWVKMRGKPPLKVYKTPWP